MTRALLGVRCQLAVKSEGQAERRKAWVHWEIWVVRECAMYLGQYTGHGIEKLDRLKLAPWLLSEAMWSTLSLSPLPPPHKIYLLLKTKLGQNEGGGGSVLANPGTDMAPRWGAHCPLSSWKSTAPCLPSFEPGSSVSKSDRA